MELYTGRVKAKDAHNAPCNDEGHPDRENDEREESGHRNETDEGQGKKRPREAANE